MTDLDFDELDKAVSTLMGGVEGAGEGSKEAKTLKINTTLSEDEQPEYEKIEAVAKKIGSEAIDTPQERTAVLPDSTRKSSRSVRFMDVMHKSSAVKATAPAKSKTTVDESGAKVLTLSESVEAVEDALKVDIADEAKPVADAIDGNDVSEVAVAGEPKDDAVVVKRLKPVAKSADVEDDQPEKAEAEAIDSSSEPDKVSEDDLAAKIIDEFKTDDEEASDDNEPLSTPFIADAQVEKRPLGGGAAQATEPGAKSKRSKQVVEEAPEEFNDALLAVETSEATDDSNKSREKAAKNAIFDMDEYHKPVEKSAQGGSPWLWVVMVLVILVLGGVAGIAAFMLIG